MNVIGVDVGREGAFARIAGTQITIWDMPKSHERGVDLRAVNEVVKTTPPCIVYIEWNTARPLEVPDYAFRFGLQTGQLEALFWARGFDVRHVVPNKWKGDIGLPGKTDDPTSLQGLEFLRREYPCVEVDALILGPRGGIKSGRVDAWLIAHWGLRVASSPVGRKGGKRPPRFIGATAEDFAK